ERLARIPRGEAAPGRAHGAVSHRALLRGSPRAPGGRGLDLHSKGSPLDHLRAGERTLLSARDGAAIGGGGPLFRLGACVPAAAWAACRYRDRALTLGFAWIFVTLIPALAFPLVTYMADRYLYLPSLGFCWVLAVTIVRLAERVPKVRSRTLAITAMSLLPG